MRDDLKSQIFDLVTRYYELNRKVLPVDKVPPSGKVFDEHELINLVDAALEGWWTDSKWVAELERRLRDFLGVGFVSLVNSGSSANFVAMKTLSSVKLGDRRIKPGDEVITTAACFPTTVNPIIDIGAVPVFVDVNMGTYNASVESIRNALSPKTKAVFMAHTLGNPFDAEAVREFCDANGLWMIEDNCDALGSRHRGRYTGTVGHMGTCSFYPAHHITTAEGGAIFTNDKLLDKIARSVRDWGRDCWCGTGQDDTCKNRFNWKLGDLPEGYDHKYIYSEIGYNLKMTDLQAAIGVAQMDKLQGFITSRKKNFAYLKAGLEKFNDVFILPEATEGSDPSWFGFILTIKDGSFTRKEIVEFLNDSGIGTRLLFSGNVTKQPYFISTGVKYRISGSLENTDRIMEDAFWVGVTPLLSDIHLDYLISKIADFLSTKTVREAKPND